MSVGSVGGVGGAMAGGGISAMAGAAPLNFGGLNGAVNPSGTQGLSTPQMQQLTQLLDGFSSAQILMALMLMGASNQQQQQGGGSDGAMAFLAGLAMAQQVGQGLGNLGGIGMGTSTGDVGTGASCNLLA